MPGTAVVSTPPLDGLLRCNAGFDASQPQSRQIHKVPERRCHRGEEVTRDDGAGVVLDERSPSLPNWVPGAPALLHVFAYGIPQGSVHRYRLRGEHLGTDLAQVNGCS